MIDDPGGTDKKDQGKSKAADTPSQSPAKKEGDEGSLHGAKDHQETPEKEQKPSLATRSWRWIKGARHFFSKSEWVNVVLTGVIALTGVIGIILVIQSGADTQKMIRAAQEQACAALSFARSAELIDGGVHDAVSQLNLQAGETSRLAEDSETANANSANADRPWIGIALQSEEIAVGKTPQMHISAINAGKRPARITWMVAAGNLFKQFPKDPSYAAVTGPRSTWIIVPNAPISMDYSLTHEPITDWTMKIINGRSQTLFEYAKVEYTDIRTGAKYFTHACWRYIPATVSTKSGFYSCTEYNEAK